MFDGAQHRRCVARESDPVDRRQRIHDADNIIGTERLDEARQRLAYAQRVAEPHVVVVEEEDKEAHVVARDLDFFVDPVAKLARWRIPGTHVAVNSYQPELLDCLGFAVLEYFEIGFLQVGDWLALVIGNDDIDAYEVDTCAEGRLLAGGIAARRCSALRRFTLRRSTLRRRALLLSDQASDRRPPDETQRDSDPNRDGPAPHIPMIAH
jgi:hypothetical protein